MSGKAIVEDVPYESNLNSNPNEQSQPKEPPIIAPAAAAAADAASGSDLPTGEMTEQAIEAQRIERLRKKAQYTAERETALTVRQSFEEFLATGVRCAKLQAPEGEPTLSQEDELELECRRFLFLTAALFDVHAHALPKTAIDKLIKADGASQLKWPYKLPKGTRVRAIADLIKKHKTALQYVSSADAVVDTLRKELDAAGEVLQLQKDDVIDSQFVKHEAVERLMQENPKLNKLVVFDPQETDYMRKLLANAVMASEGIRGGLQIVDKLDGGVNAESSPEVRELAATTLTAVARAIHTYRREENIITRSDGDGRTGIMANLDDVLEHNAKRNLHHQDIRKEPWFAPGMIGLAMKNQEVLVSYMVAMLPIVDCAIFTPRLAALCLGNSMPRVVEASRVLRIYVAALAVIKANVAAPSARALYKRRKLTMRKLQRASFVDEDGQTAVVVNPNFMNLPQYASVETSNEALEECFAQLHLEAMQEFEKGVRLAREQFKLDTQLASTEMSQERRELIVALHSGSYTPIGNASAAADPLAHARAYYGALWYLAQQVWIGLLLKYELAIVKRLHLYLSTENFEHWRARRDMPAEVQGHPLTTQLLGETNAAIATTRRTVVELISKAKDFKKAPRYSGDVPTSPDPLKDNDSLDTERVFAGQSWSPTFKQMREYDAHIDKLFLLSAEQAKIASEFRPNEPGKKNKK